MQTIVCQTAETFSPEFAPQTQGFQKPSENEKPRESDFLSMLNENLNKQDSSRSEPVAEKKPEEESSRLSKAEEPEKKVSSEDKVQEKEASQETEKVSEKDEPKKLVKKEISQDKGDEKIDAYIQGALELKNSKTLSEKGDDKKTQKSGAKKVTVKSDEKKIDPKQLEFLRKISQKASEKDSEGLKNFVSEKQGEEQELSFPAESLLAGQKVVQDASDYTYANQESLQNKKPGDSKISELRKNGKKPLIQVTDLRTKVRAAGQKENVKDIKKNFVTSVKETEKGSVQMTMDLNAQAEKNILSLDSQSAASDGSTFQAMLKNQITQNAGDFVKAANIVLRDNNQGQINLILHPEELGNVKINMEVHGKTIVGHITVASREAMEAFGQSADALKNSFLQSGFEDATFDVTFAGSQMQFAHGQAQEDAEGKASQGRKIYGEFTQESLTSVQDISDNFIDDDVSVNIVA